MAGADSVAEEAMTNDEIRGTGEGEAASSTSRRNHTVQNAFTRLMTPKPKPSPAPKPQTSNGNPFKDRMGLGSYLEHPENFPASVVIYHTPDFVVIHDKFPKASLHTLILPRSPHYSSMHPFDALADAGFRRRVQDEVVKVRVLVAKELQRRFGRYSRSDTAREAVLDGHVEAPSPSNGDPAVLPPGRDWTADIICGVHTVPSMSHMHIHVLSRDMHSPSLRHRKHYNSFNTPFLVDVAEFPLGLDDPRRNPKEAAFLRRDLKCWRCGRNFGNQFKRLKEHLDEEFVAWRAE